MPFGVCTSILHGLLLCAPFIFVLTVKSVDLVAVCDGFFCITETLITEALFKQFLICTAV